MVLSKFTYAFIILFLGYKECNSATLALNDELLQVSVIFRHGARTTSRFYPEDPHKNQTFYPTGLGALTNDGKLMMYKLGQFLRTEYNHFLGEDYVEEMLYVRSTDVTRTKMSAQLLLAGLWPPSKKQLWNPELKWLPIPIYNKPNEQEDLINPYTCPYRTYLLSSLPNQSDVQSIFLEPQKTLYKYASENSGMTITTPEDILELYFILSMEDELGLPLPNWTKSIYPDAIYKAASKVYEYINFNPEVRKFNAGYLLKKILNDALGMAERPNGKSKTKLFLYSGHETTLGTMLEALKIFNQRIPPYSSAIIFELHRLGQQYFIKLRFKGEIHKEELRDLTIPGCSTSCPIKTFIELQKSVLPTTTIDKACKLRLERM